jgi:hypothetical protein
MAVVDRPGFDVAGLQRLHALRPEHIHMQPPIQWIIFKMG